MSIGGHDALVEVGADHIKRAVRPAAAIAGVQRELQSLTSDQAVAVAVVVAAALDATTPWPADYVVASAGALVVSQLPVVAGKRPVLTTGRLTRGYRAAGKGRCFLGLPRILRVAIVHSEPLQQLCADGLRERFTPVQIAALVERGKVPRTVAPGKEPAQKLNGEQLRLFFIRFGWSAIVDVLLQRCEAHSRHAAGVPVDAAPADEEDGGAGTVLASSATLQAQGAGSSAADEADRLAAAVAAIGLRLKRGETADAARAARFERAQAAAKAAAQADAAAAGAGEESDDEDDDDDEDYTFGRQRGRRGFRRLGGGG